jgi:ribosome maturation factor RimP
VRVAVREIETEIRRLAEPILAESGLELVEVALKGAPGNQLVRLDIDRPGADGVDITDCQRVSRTLGEVLERAELIPGGYVLEVSSPGVDRPIRSADDFRRNMGRRIVVTTSDADGTRRSHHGTLLGCENGELRLKGEKSEEIRIPLNGIVNARQEVAF